jgi:hypothetical protein
MRNFYIEDIPKIFSQLRKKIYFVRVHNFLKNIFSTKNPKKSEHFQISSEPEPEHEPEPKPEPQEI